MPKKSTAVSPMMNKLSGHIATAVQRPVPTAVIARAKLHLVDTFAAMISGSRLLPGRKAIDYVKTDLMPDFDFDAFNHEYPENGALAEETQVEIEQVEIEIEENIAAPGTASEEVDKW